jgi:hypothetical protein
MLRGHIHGFIALPEDLALLLFVRNIPNFTEHTKYKYLVYNIKTIRNLFQYSKKNVNKYCLAPEVFSSTGSKPAAGAGTRAASIRASAQSSR